MGNCCATDDQGTQNYENKPMQADSKPINFKKGQSPKQKTSARSTKPRTDSDRRNLQILIESSDEENKLQDKSVQPFPTQSDQESDFQCSSEESQNEDLTDNRWEGWFMERNQKHTLAIDYFYISKNGKFHGNGKDEAGEFKWEGMKDQDTKFKAKKKYDHHNIFYWGSIIEDPIRVSGDWGFTLGDSQGTFELKKLSKHDYTSPRLADEDASDFSSATEESIATGARNWTGHFYSKGTRHELECDGLYLGEKGTFHGDGEDEAGEFKWVGFVKDDSFLLKKKFESHSVFFWGARVAKDLLTHNQEISLRGRWGFTLNDSEEQCALVLTFQEDEFVEEFEYTQ